MRANTGGNKIMQQAEQLATFSAMQGGLTRAYLTPEHQQAHAQIEKWMQQAGLETWQDSVGNQWARKASVNPDAKTLLIGSHSDTVANAGKYDGMLGVLLGIEALSVLKDESFPFHIDLVAFADEEGVRFNTTLIGSSAVAGCFQDAWLTLEDEQGISMAQALTDFGLEPALAGSDKRRREELLAYLEVHIEQGPLLESENLPVGVVTGIAGAKRYVFKVKGMAGHAGTVPIPLRKDALCGVAEMIVMIESFAAEKGIVATVGKCELPHSAVNVISGEVHFSLDIRCDEQSLLEACCQQLLVKLNAIAQKRQLKFEHENIYQATAVPCSEKLQQQWSDVVAKQTGKAPFLLPSGAGHDAMVIANITDIGMLFVRCEKGISHHPKEQVIESDVDVALSCLIEMIKASE